MNSSELDIRRKTNPFTFLLFFFLLHFGGLEDYYRSNTQTFNLNALFNNKTSVHSRFHVHYTSYYIQPASSQDIHRTPSTFCYTTKPTKCAENDSRAKLYSVHLMSTKSSAALSRHLADNLIWRSLAGHSGDWSCR